MQNLVSNISIKKNPKTFFVFTLGTTVNDGLLQAAVRIEEKKITSLAKCQSEGTKKK